MKPINYFDLIKKKVSILGGGQLGKMLAIAAHKLGVEITIFSSVNDAPALQVTNKTIVADYTDQGALLKLAQCTDVVTLESENIPSSTLDFLLSNNVTVFPTPDVLGTTQDRLKEKQFVSNLGIKTAEFTEVKNFAHIDLDYPFILKTRWGGYDGKGQYLISSKDDKVEVKEECIAEKIISFNKEISLITACDLNGRIEFFPIAENVHVNGILHTSSVPANISDRLTKEVEEIGRAIVEKMNYIGVIVIELFVTDEGQLLVNEIAPRVHNSGHWSVEACNVSQFEQHIRAICGLPIKEVRLYFPCTMYNLIGSDVIDINNCLMSPEKSLTIYGKKEVKAGRKMGHITLPKV